MRTLLYPPPLKKGETLGVIAPAGQLQDKTYFTNGIKILNEMGFQVKFPMDLWPGTEYLADSDDNRGREFNDFVKDSDTKGLISLRGGYGCLRMLDRIDLSLITHHPKILVGFSDITILQNYLYEKTGLVSLHGPVLTSLGGASSETLESFFNFLTGKWSNSIGGADIEVLKNGPGIVAPLVGGNLASLVTLLGTPYDFSWRKKIVFLEDINEPIYKLDRMLTQLKLAGKLDNLAGLILGDFSNSGCSDDIEKLRYLESVWSRVLQLCSCENYAIWGNFPSGHCSCNLTFPLGAPAEMNREKKRLFFNLP